MINCWTWHEDPIGEPAVVRIVLPLVGSTVPYCQQHLNQYLDLADAHPAMEPAALEWLTPRPT